MKQKITLGRADKADFPELGLKDADIKMDTGAYTSAIHCHKIELKTIDGKEFVIFTLLDPSHSQYADREFSTSNFHTKLIKNSFGSSENRFVVETNIKLFDKEYPIELSLSKRGEMKFPILIGRRFLVGNFIVDSSKANLSYKRKQKTINQNKS